MARAGGEAIRLQAERLFRAAAPSLADMPQGNATWVISAEALQAWADAARPGERRTYARAPSMGLPRHEAGVRIARQLFDDGLVTLVQQRINAEVTDYIAVRLDRNGRPAPQLRLAQPVPPMPASDEAAMMMAILRRIAAAKRVCPTNRELGRMVGGLTPDQAAYLLRKLVTAGRIRIDSYDRGGRVITITATGKRTARPA